MMETHTKKLKHCSNLTRRSKETSWRKKPSSHFIHLETKSQNRIDFTPHDTTTIIIHIEWCNSPDNSLDERDRVRETLELTHFGYTEWKNESANSILPDYHHEIPPNIKMRLATPDIAKTRHKLRRWLSDAKEKFIFYLVLRQPNNTLFFCFFFFPMIFVIIKKLFNRISCKHLNTSFA